MKPQTDCNYLNVTNNLDQFTHILLCIIIDMKLRNKDTSLYF